MRLYQAKLSSRPPHRSGQSPVAIGAACLDPTPRPRRWKGMMRAFKGTTLALAVLVATGAGYEFIAGLGDATRYPPPGRLVDVGGFRLHIACTGKGSPTIVLDAGLGGTSLDWALVRGRLSARTRVCAYDRAGMGWSDAGQAPRTPARIAGDLRGLLTNAGEPGPYVLVAHSLSGKSARLFAVAYPDDIAGLVLVDTPSERVDALMTADEAKAFAAALARQASLISLARRLGLVRFLGPVLAGPLDLPPDVAGKMLMLQSQPQSLDATTEEGLARSANDDELSRAMLGTIPLVVIVAGESNAAIPGWAEAQKDLAARSNKARLIVADGSSHSVQFDQPEVIIDAVLSLLTADPAGN
jgi:pimeloyl-ACP methyl ester carboxylesterase